MRAIFEKWEMNSASNMYWYVVASAHIYVHNCGLRNITFLYKDGTLTYGLQMPSAICFRK